MSERERVPAWMAQLGVKEGEWLDLSKAQLRTMQLPDKTLKARVWATGMLHTSGYKSQAATTMRNGKKVPLTSGGIIAELWKIAKQHYATAGIQATDERWEALKEAKEDVRQVLSDLEREGVAERTDMHGTPVRKLPLEQSRRLPSGRTQIFFWLIPRPPNVEDVQREWERRKPQIPTPDDPEPEQEGHGKNPEVGKISLPLPPIWQILQGLKIGDTDKAQVN